MFRGRGNQIQTAAGKFLFEFTVRLVNQFNKVQPANLQLHISRAGFGGLYQIFRQIFQTEGFLFQHIQITQDFLILNMFPLNQIYIINNRSQRCLDVMGDIGDQVGFQPLAFYFFRQSHLQTLADIVKIFCSFTDFPGKLGFIYLVGGFPICQMADSQVDPVPICRTPEHDIKDPQIQTDPKSCQHSDHDFQCHRKNVPL